MKNIYKDDNSNTAIVIDKLDMVALSYDIEPTTGELRMETEGILNELDTQMYQEAEEKLKVSLLEYGVLELNK